MSTYATWPRVLWRRFLWRLGLQQILCRHHYWPYIREDGRANVQKCGKCGKVHPCS